MKEIQRPIEQEVTKPKEPTFVRNLWGEVLADENIGPILKKERGNPEHPPRVLLIGNRRATLIYTIWASWVRGEIRKPEIFVVAKDPQIVKLLKRLNPEGFEARIVPSLEACLPSQDLIITPTLNSFYVPNLAKQAKNALAEEGFLLGGTRGLVKSAKTGLELSIFKIPHRKRNFGRNTLFIFSKEQLIASSSPEKAKKRRLRAIYPA